jgi:hypothetical protein
VKGELAIIGRSIAREIGPWPASPFTRHARGAHDAHPRARLGIAQRATALQGSEELPGTRRSQGQISYRDSQGLAMLQNERGG